MKKNIDTQGRLVRLAMAISILILAWWLQSWILFAISLFVFYEAAASWCVLNQLLGKSSCSTDNKPK